MFLLYTQSHSSRRIVFAVVDQWNDVAGGKDPLSPFAPSLPHHLLCLPRYNARHLQ